MKIYKPFEDKLVKFFYKHDKKKMLLAGKIAKRFWKHEDLILDHLAAKYGVSNEKTGKKKKDKPVEVEASTENVEETIEQSVNEQEPIEVNEMEETTEPTDSEEEEKTEE